MQNWRGRLTKCADSQKVGAYHVGVGKHVFMEELWFFIFYESESIYNFQKSFYVI